MGEFDLRIGTSRTARRRHRKPCVTPRCHRAPQASGIPVVDVVAHTSCLWGQLLLAPLVWVTPAPPLLAVPAAPDSASDAAGKRLTELASTDASVADHALPVLLGQFAQHLGPLTLLQAAPIAEKQVYRCHPDSSWASGLPNRVALVYGRCNRASRDYMSRGCIKPTLVVSPACMR